MRNKILLIEDEEMIVGLYEEAFKKAGFEIQSLRTGNQAIEAIREIREGKRERPDLILLDLILPDIEGAGVLKEFKKYPETKDIFVSVLTNYPNSRLITPLLNSLKSLRKL